MTELQLRLWCLWMCETFAGIDVYGEDEDGSFFAATEGASQSMLDLMTLLSCWRDPLECLDLLDKMP